MASFGKLMDEFGRMLGKWVKFACQCAIAYMVLCMINEFFLSGREHRTTKVVHVYESRPVRPSRPAADPPARERSRIGMIPPVRVQPYWNPNCQPRILPPAGSSGVGFYGYGRPYQALPYGGAFGGTNPQLYRP